MIPSIFKEVLEQPISNAVVEARAGGAHIIGYTCSYVPEPLLAVDGLVPVRMRAPGVVGTPLADTYLSSVVCSYTRSLLEFAMDGVYDELDGWVFTASCDHLRRLYDNLDYLVKPSFNYILDLPHRFGEEALGWYIEECGRLISALSDHYGIDTSDGALASAIQRHNETVGLLESIDRMRRIEKPLITGTDFHALAVACAAAPVEAIRGPLRELAAELADADVIDDYRARLLVVGSQLDDPGFIRLIESMGGLVVGGCLCIGSLHRNGPIPEEGNPLAAIAGYYLGNISCPRMMEDFDKRVEKIIEAAKECLADGIVLETMKFCDTWGVESPPLVQALRQAGIPVLRLEREYAPSGEGQLRTRVQAFLESMGK